MTLGSDGCARACYYDGIADRLLEEAVELAQLIAQVWCVPLRAVQQVQLFDQTPSRDCAMVALCHAACFLTCDSQLEQDLETSLRDAAQSHAGQRGAFVGTGGLSEDQDQSLAKILEERGVPADKVKDRIQVAITKVGPAPRAEALRAKNPWQMLKAAGSKPGTMFKWVQQDELELHIAQKASEKFGSSVPKAKAKKATAENKKAQYQRLQVDSLHLQMGHFGGRCGRNNDLQGKHRP